MVPGLHGPWAVGTSARFGLRLTDGWDVTSPYGWVHYLEVVLRSIDKRAYTTARCTAVVSERRLGCTACTGLPYLAEGSPLARVVSCSEYFLAAADNGALASLRNRDAPCGSEWPSPRDRGSNDMRPRLSSLS